MSVRIVRRFRFGLLLPLSLSLGCLPAFTGGRQIQHDMARTMLDVQRILQVNTETQDRVENALSAIQKKSQADTEMIVTNLAELEQRIDALQEALGVIRSQVEEIRFRTAGESVDRVAIRVGQGNTASTAVLEGSSLLLEGQNALTQENYEQARRLFQEFLNRFPASTRAPDAQMRIADSYYRQEEWAAARAAYQVMETRYLTSPRVPEALMKMAYCEEKLGRETQAVEILDRLIRNHPKWEQIERAREALNRYVKVEPQVPPVR